MRDYPNLPSGDYYGKGRTRGQNETDSLKLVHPSLSRKEPDLYHLKWWDYRLMHHVEATRYWSWCYSQAVRKWVATTSDVALAASVSTFDKRDVLTTREATSAVLARQAMDSIGCRYPWAFEWVVSRFSDRGWRTFPRPNQLYGEELLLDMADAWAQECGARLQRPEALCFRTRGPSTIRPQVKGWLVQSAKSKVSSALTWMPISTLYKEGYLDPEDVRQALPESMAARALSVAL